MSIKAKVKGEGEERTVKPPPEKYEVFVGNELAIQAIWKVIYPACPGEDDLASFLTNRAYSRGIPLCQLKGKSRDKMVELILLDGVDQNRTKKNKKANEKMEDLIQRLQDFICTNNRVGELTEEEQYQHLTSLRFMVSSFKLSMKEGGAK